MIREVHLDPSHTTGASSISADGVFLSLSKSFHAPLLISCLDSLRPDDHHEPCLWRATCMCLYLPLFCSGYKSRRLTWSTRQAGLNPSPAKVSRNPPSSCQTVLEAILPDLTLYSFPSDDGLFHRVSPWDVTGMKCAILVNQSIITQS